MNGFIHLTNYQNLRYITNKHENHKNIKLKHQQNINKTH